jgi:hypothetical protein
MARLRNRIRKADYFTDGELLRWHRDKRATYSGLYALAEDSGCLEDDPFMWKLVLWPSPLDADITVELLTQWRDELVEAGKLIPYEADGERFLYIRTFLQHEHPRNPQRPDLPLPEWLRCESVGGTSKDGKTWVRTTFRDTKYSVQTPYGLCTDSVHTPQPRPAPSRVPKGTSGKGVGDGREDESSSTPVPRDEPVDPERIAEVLATSTIGKRFGHLIDDCRGAK